MDPLSDVLQAVRLNSQIYFKAEFLPPWGMDVPSGDNAAFHMVVEGQCWLWHEGLDTPLCLNAGDIAVFPLGAAHWIASSPSAPLIPGETVLKQSMTGRRSFGYAQHGEPSTIICGHFEIDSSGRHPLIASLPSSLIFSSSNSMGPVEVKSLLDVLIKETENPRVGSDVVAKKIAESIFVTLLREHVARQTETSGFLAGLTDREISVALTSIHAEPDRSWSIAKLASLSGLSRSTFAERFRSKLGITPMEYLRIWRLQKARQLLTETDLATSAVALQVGFLSPASFARAFRRQYSMSPADMRAVG